MTSGRLTCQYHATHCCRIVCNGGIFKSGTDLGRELGRHHSERERERDRLTGEAAKQEAPSAPMPHPSQLVSHIMWTVVFATLQPHTSRASGTTTTHERG
jgi:hypothetical protein